MASKSPLPRGGGPRHGGTVGHADTFAGFGTLVIVEHGAGKVSLYGCLASAGGQRGDAEEAGHELGRVGLAPAGPPALYFRDAHRR
jgi:septal ring factor EnvC (AmiA/AmiB activator)